VSGTNYLVPVDAELSSADALDFEMVRLDLAPAESGVGTLISFSTQPGKVALDDKRYLARAREAQVAGDVVGMENCYPHAEHYLRVMRGTGDDRRAEL